MAKTTFSSGVVVTSQWLNGAQQIYFDGQDLDWHYPPLGLSSLVTSGPDGLDSYYVTLGTEQPSLTPTGLYVSGEPISGTKVVAGIFNFGFDPLVIGNPPNDVTAAPRSYTTNDKFEFANGIPAPTTPQKFTSLNDADLVTKLILADYIDYILDTLVIDNGVYASVGDPTCVNYEGGDPLVCPL